MSGCRHGPPSEARRSACVLPGWGDRRKGPRGSGRLAWSPRPHGSRPRPQLYLRELLRLTHLRFYQHLVSLGEDGLQMLFCHRWLLLCFKREFPEAEALRIWEACWAHYQVSQRGRRSASAPRKEGGGPRAGWRAPSSAAPAPVTHTSAPRSQLPAGPVGLASDLQLASPN